MQERDKMRGVMCLWIIACCLFSACDGGNDEVTEPSVVKPVVKTNDMKVYMHYMPWFQSKPVTGYWGSHWRMANKNPEHVDSNGKREIASHYYPLIGPYDSSDEAVLEYHLLLMKYAGIDGILIDWYGSQNLYDYRVNLKGSNAIIDKLDDVGLKFAVVYEEYTAGAVEDNSGRDAITVAKEDINYLKTHYFSKAEHLTIDNKPLLLTFGPRYFKYGSEWEQIFSDLPTKPVFLPLWGHGGLTGSTESGEFAWVDFTSTLTELDQFYNNPYVKLPFGAAFPRFHDFYEEGGQGTSYGYVAYNDGATLRNTLKEAEDSNLEYLQLVTWNDFGEGTVIEPTLEAGFEPLTIIQEFTGVSYDSDELELIHEYYLKKVKYGVTEEEILQKAFKHLVALETEQARTLLEGLE